MIGMIRGMQRVRGGEEAEASAEYCRRARRLRWRFGGDPIRLHQSLRELSEERGEAGGVGRESILPSTMPLEAGRAVAEAFAERVVQQLDGAILRYSNRQALVREAEKVGISRFEANLIIAAVQYRHGTPVRRAEGSRAGWPMLVGFAMVVQALIVVYYWRMFGA